MGAAHTLYIPTELLSKLPIVKQNIYLGEEFVFLQPVYHVFGRFLAVRESDD